MGTQTAGVATAPTLKTQKQRERSGPGRVSARAAQRILVGLMFPAMIMPVSSAMTRVALPVMRDEFAIPADTTAWINTAFTLPFLLLMPVYGRMSDAVGRRRLMLAGIAIFALGTLLTMLAVDLSWLMLGRAVQGLGAAGLMPLAMAFISAIFDAESRGKALGTWSTVGPTAAFIGPPLAGLLVERWGWRAAYAPSLMVSILAVTMIAILVPAGLSTIRPNFWRRFDWIGVALHYNILTAFLFYLSSRPITGVPALQDWRLLGITLLSLFVFLRWESRCTTPFVPLHLFRRRLFSTASTSAALRMATMAGAGFLLPLYLVDVRQMGAEAIGLILMLMPGGMAVMVRFGGQWADRWGSRVPVSIGFLIQGGVMLLLWRLPPNSALWLLCAILILHGVGVGLMLAALHRAAMSTMETDEMGSAAGLYSMIRFAGMATGTALAGVLLQAALDSTVDTAAAYQIVFLAMGIFSILGLISTQALRE